MKRNVKLLLKYTPWLLILLIVDAFYAMLLWLADVQAFYAMITVIVLATVLLFSAVCLVLLRQSRKREAAFSAFLHNPEEYQEELLLKTVSPAEKEYIRLLGRNLRDMNHAYAQLQGKLNEQEEYVEAWAHETKTPLSLLTLLLDNRREELPAPVSVKLDYIRSRMQESIDQMLFYARLKGTRKDYLFEQICVRTCVERVLEDDKPLLNEKNFQIHSCLSDDTVYSDRRGLHFLLSQIISNSIKYCSKEPQLCISSFRRDNRYVLSIRDNGPGVRDCDLPYIFEKGFTGGSGEGRQKATGMGLYLALEMAKELNLSLEAHSQWGEGFEMKIAFPVVDIR